MLLPENPWNQIYCGDNLAYLRELVERKISFNLIIADAPYNVGKDFGNETDRQDDKTFLKDIQDRCELMSKLLTPTGSLLFFCSYRYVGRIQNILDAAIPKSHARMMIWFYENGMSRQTKEPVTEFEPLLWYAKDSKDWTYNVDDVRVPYKTERVKNPVYKLDREGNKRAWIADPRGRKRGDVWQYPTLSGKCFEAERTEHETQKPESFVYDLLRAYLPKNSDGKYEARVLDPYIGSGTTAVCCEKLNKEGNHKIIWMGMELEQRWVDTAHDRVEKQRSKIIEPDIFG
ncbi:MAG: site-specific DNA-methyltransferase [Candidatus Competibacteraceae bacterium]|nr:site-specific DNA-methyltransferase [Candidatus Competibacteraceae bacterium]